jgi:hypothetical protein
MLAHLRERRALRAAAAKIVLAVHLDPADRRAALQKLILVRCAQRKSGCSARLWS